MPPTVRTPWLPAGCVLGVVLAGLAVAEPLAPELVFPPELAFVLVFVVGPDLVFPTDGAFAVEGVFAAGAAGPLEGAAPLTACAPDGLPELGVCVPDVAPLLGVPAPEPLPGEAVYDCPATEAVTACGAAA